ncbi:hypothetical protein FRA_29c03630 [Francisella sp. W12-1067]|nr:hypothetical protein FRA_29c03630 [Francisella sp. W12-1067]
MKVLHIGNNPSFGCISYHCNSFPDRFLGKKIQHITCCPFYDLVHSKNSSFIFSGKQTAEGLENLDAAIYKETFGSIIDFFHDNINILKLQLKRQKKTRGWLYSFLPEIKVYQKMKQALLNIDVIVIDQTGGDKIGVHRDFLAIHTNTIKESYLSNENLSYNFFVFLLLRCAEELGISVLGSCNGAQMIWCYLGGAIRDMDLTKKYSNGVYLTEKDGIQNKISCFDGKVKVGESFDSWDVEEYIMDSWHTLSHTEKLEYHINYDHSWGMYPSPFLRQEVKILALHPLHSKKATKIYGLNKFFNNHGVESFEKVDITNPSRIKVGYETAIESFIYKNFLGMQSHPDMKEENIKIYEYLLEKAIINKRTSKRSLDDFNTI